MCVCVCVCVCGGDRGGRVGVSKPYAIFVQCVCDIRITYVGGRVAGVACARCFTVRN